MKMNPRFIILAVVVILIILLMRGSCNTAGGTDSVAISTLVAQAKSGDIARIEVRGQNISAFRDVSQKKPSFTSKLPDNTDIVTLLIVAGVEIGPPSGLQVDRKSSSSFLGIMLRFLPLLFMLGFFFFIMRSMQGGGSVNRLTRSGAKTFHSQQMTNVTFADVAGAEEAKQELEEIVEFLKTPWKFFKFGARIPRGVLLIGSPGTGKTLMARAVAGEAGVPFFHISGSEFVQMFVGVGAARVRDLFDQAKRNAPCIVFIDEIDAVGRHRGSGIGGGHDEREQTLNQILVSMDGFDNKTNIIVLAATNRPDILDPALMRPGRFDRKVTLDLPDIKGRVAILKVHSAGKPFAPEINFEDLAKQTPGSSGADLANMANEAAISAARDNKNSKKEITEQHFEAAIDRVLMGPEKKSRVINQREKEMTAYHEAGHALAAWTLPDADKVHKISIVARGAMGGHTSIIPEEDRSLWTKKQFKARLIVAMSGRAAEEQIFEEVTTGASSDIEQATKIAEAMIRQYGMSENLGLRAFSKPHGNVFLGHDVPEGQNYSDKIAEKIDEEMDHLLASACAQAKEIIVEHEPKLVILAEYLIERETVSGDEMNRILEGQDCPVEEVEESQDHSGVEVKDVLENSRPGPISEDPEGEIGDVLAGPAY